MEFGGIQWSDALGILEGGVLGSVSGFRVVRGDFGVDLVVEREAVMVEVWVRLGGKMGVILEGVWGLVSVRPRGRKFWFFRRKWGEFSRFSQAGGVQGRRG